MKTIQLGAGRSAAQIGSVQANTWYWLRAAGFWWDGLTPCTADGYRAPFRYLIGRTPVQMDGVRFMRMWGCIGDTTRPGASAAWFKIGADFRFQAAASGFLWLVANDHGNSYHSNRGAVTVYLSQDEMPQIGVNTYWTQLTTFLSKIHGIPVIIGLLSLLAYFLIITPQGRDVMVAADRGMAGPYGHSSTHTMIILAATTLLLSVQAWLWSRSIVVENFGEKPARWSWLVEWGPRALGVAPFLIGLTSLIIVQACARNCVVFALIGLATFAFYVFRRRLFGWGNGGNDNKNRRRARFSAAIGSLVGALSLVGAAAMMFAFTFSRVELAQWFGPAGVAYLAVALMIPAIAWASNFLRVTRLPLASSLVVFAFMISPLTDDHQIGRRELSNVHFQANGDLVAARPTLDDALDQWLSRQPISAESGGLPIVLIATAGGASRAGYWAALTLSQLQNLAARATPAFAFSDRVFAISSVSGGALGSTGFVLDTPGQNPPAPGEASQSRAARFNSGDYLSPALAGLLFPDLFHHFVPLWPMPDRAQALEESWEERWKKVAGPSAKDSNAVEQSFLDLWGPLICTSAKGKHAGCANSEPPSTFGWRPLLLINGTREEDGRRVITAPIKLDPNIFLDSVDFFELTQRDIPVSTAIHNGARFPIVSPGGRLLDGDGHWQGHLLDGGYFDNAGTETLRDLMQGVNAWWAKPSTVAAAQGKWTKLVPILIEINNDDGDWSASFARTAADQQSSGLIRSQNDVWAEDVLGPLMGNLNVGASHGTVAAVHLARFHTQNSTLLGSYNFIHLFPLHRKSLPMDWVLSSNATHQAQIVAGVPTDNTIESNHRGHPAANSVEYSPDVCSVNRDLTDIIQVIQKPLERTAQRERSLGTLPKACALGPPRRSAFGDMALEAFRVSREFENAAGRRRPAG